MITDKEYKELGEWCTAHAQESPLRLILELFEFKMLGKFKEAVQVGDTDFAKGELQAYQDIILTLTNLFNWTDTGTETDD